MGPGSIECEDRPTVTELLIVVALVMTHLAAPYLLRFAERFVPDPVPIAHGLAVAFVFLHLLPEIGKGLTDRGLALGWLVLVGFLAFNAAENQLRASPRPRARLALQVGQAAIVSWLIGASLPGAVANGPAEAVMVLLAASMHLLEGHHRTMEKGALAPHLRVLLAAAVVAGMVTDELWAEEVEALDQGLVALVAGAILTTVFRDHFELDVANRRFKVLGMAALGYGALVTLATV
jgi:hypothetical protein